MVIVMCTTMTVMVTYFGGDASDGCDADNGDHGGIDGACASDEKC